ncbi:MAG: glycosyl hydrolase [Akkermansiaceae bacterium]
MPSIYALLIILFSLTASLHAGEFGEQAPASAPGYPSRDAGLDALPGFQNPPAGYGQVPFWWWTGDALDEERLLWQVRELHKKGISGVQVNYSHTDSPGWPSDVIGPEIFSAEWWDIYSRVSEECGKLGMGIGLSTYTLDWDNGGENLFKKLFYDKPELNAIELKANKHAFKAGEGKSVPCIDGAFAAWAYQVKNGVLQRGGTDLTKRIKNGQLTWTAPDGEGEWQVWTFGTRQHKGTLNPLLEGSGNTVVQGFYQQFENQNKGTSKGLNYFFNDELEVGLKKFAWNTDFHVEFFKRKGYNLFDVLPAMWEDMGDVTPKLRIDYADVRMALMEERYFEPIYNWHTERGIIFGCDNHGRGLQPNAYGDYFRATRWYSAPGHDTPGGNADVTKGKVSSSIAKLYQRPRVWLEAYHSLGWGATPERLMFATRENYLYGCTLFNLHGLYYSTYGSHWEWAPPCYHFRMPYWAHMGTFLKYFDRLSYLMSQGDAVADVAVIYPVTPYEAETNGNEATQIAFHLGNKLMAAGINFDFIDHQSIARAKIKNGQLVVENANASYKALIFPNMEAARWNNLEKAAAFSEGGGLVLSVGSLPLATDQAGANDPALEDLLAKAIPSQNRLASAGEALEKIKTAFVHDVRGLNRTVRTLHRKIGPRDVYLTMDARPGDVVEFRAKGAVELWDPWTGKTSPLRVIKETATGTHVELPLEHYEAQVVVFDPHKKHVQPATGLTKLTLAKELPSDAWQVSFIPTMDNRWGDFRLPATDHNKMIGVEARRFQWTRGGKQQSQLHSYGPQMLLHKAAKPMTAAEELALSKTSRPGQGEWSSYEFSWRHGVEDNHGHQGYHGTKGKISDNFLRVGKEIRRSNGVVFLEAEEGVAHYYLWTTVHAPEATTATLHLSKPAAYNAGYKTHNANQVITPAAIYINGEKITDPGKPVSLVAGANPVLVRLDSHGEAHLVLRKQEAARHEQKLPLAMSWYQDPGLLLFDPYAATKAGFETFSFVTAPGTTGITIPEIHSTTPMQAFYNGEAMTARGDGNFKATNVSSGTATIELKLTPPAGIHGGAAIPEAISVHTNGEGLMNLGDWSENGILHNYSGGVKYRKTITLTAEEAAAIKALDLGKVIATAELSINGKVAGVRVAPPWQLDVSGLFVAGENTIEVTVYNTLSNHYQTIHNLYRGEPTSGLLGPVRLLK